VNIQRPTEKTHGVHTSLPGPRAGARLLGAGIDLGSRTVKVVTLAHDGIIRASCFDTVPFYKAHTRRNRPTGEPELALEDLGLAADAPVAATGYGRNLCAFANAETIPEIEAHVRGALSLVAARSFVLVDIGGQDTKVAVVERGRLVSFEMNDRCAAGTGRFLETIARTLDMPIQALADCVDDPVELTATCAIFSESEVVGRLVEGYTPEALAAGANLSVAKRLAAMMPAPGRKRVYASGGGAKNRAVIDLLSRRIGRKVAALARCTFAGALGCLIEALGPGERKLPSGAEWEVVDGAGV